MITVSLAQAKARLGGLIDRVEAGEEVIITRHGRPAARVQRPARERRPLPLEDLAAFRAGMPRLRRPSAELLREMRDEGENSSN